MTTTKTPLSTELSSMRNRVQRAVECFARGGAILIGDDGQRENEADLVFHAGFATPQLVNLAIREACGLLCVSISNDIADRLAIPTAPKWPGAMSHTGFTLSVDARNNITSGISASDRAHTIKLLADPKAGHQDFLSPGHVFPVRAQDGGLLARTGHTEAVMEICTFAGLPQVATMCEILDDSGEALRPENIQGDEKQEKSTGKPPWWAELPYVSTVDLLWYRLLSSTRHSSSWHELGPNETTSPRSPEKAWRLNPQLESDVLLPCSVAVYRPNVAPEKVRIRMSNGFQEWCTPVAQDAADAEITLFMQSGLNSEVPHELSDFCDLSAREGLRGTEQSVRRALTLLRALHLLATHSASALSLHQWCVEIPLLQESDRSFLCAATEL
jgi:3,4-dihydroxy 2-butanone 4-phosphate synthase / GTP cyclohydrolase II